MTDLELTMSRRTGLRRLFVALVAAELALVLLDGLVNYAELVSSSALQRLFNIAREDSLGNFLSSLQELVVAVVLWIVFLDARRGSSRAVTAGWAVAAGLFTYLGIDDGARIHERVGTALEGSLSGFPSYTWQVIFVPIFGAAAAVTLVVAWHEIGAPRIRALLGLALLGYVLAVGLDNLEGRDDGEFYDGLADDWGLAHYTVSHWAKVIEETLESFATTLFLVAFLYQLMRRANRVAVAFVD